MIEAFRTKMGPWVVGAIVGTIGLVFVFEGFYAKGIFNKGGAGSPFAGKVNGETITIREFNQALNRRLEFFKAISGGKFTDEQMKQFRVKESVWNELVSQKLMLQEAKRAGVLPSDQEVREKILEIPALKKDGRFDMLHYRKVLEANNMNESQFEDMVRDDLIIARWRKTLETQARLSPTEVEKEWLAEQDKRKVTYVVVGVESFKRSIKIEDSAVQTYVQDAKNKNLIQSKFDAAKESKFKGKKLEEVQNQIARDLLLSEKSEEARIAAEKAADSVLEAFKKGGNAAQLEAQANVLLKTVETKAKTSDWLGKKSFFIPGFSDSKAVMAEAFKSQGGLNPKQGGGPQKIASASGFFVGVVTDAQVGDLALFTEAEREKILKRLMDQKVNRISDAVIQGLTKQAKIEQNARVINEG